jgi:hypothetical protein
MRTHSLVERLLSPAGFVLVGLLFLLPFLTVSCGSATDNIPLWRS